MLLKNIFRNGNVTISHNGSRLGEVADGFEKDSYTKNGLIQNYPDLAPMLRREELSEKDFKTLNAYLDRLIKLSESRVDKMLRLVE